MWRGTKDNFIFELHYNILNGFYSDVMEYAFIPTIEPLQYLKNRKVC